MDKYEYKLKLEQIKHLVEAKDYKTAAQIADSINWKKVKSVSTLCMVGEIYEKTKRLEESREILLMAYDRSPVGRNIIYRLTLVAVKLGSLDEADEYYEEFLEIAPHDNMKYVLKYEIAKAKGVPLSEQISILEEFKEREYTEEWAFELAYLYHRNANVEKCVDICDELILWFGEGRYVEKALELKMLYQPLNKLQEDKYRRFKEKQSMAQREAEERARAQEEARIREQARAQAESQGQPEAEEQMIEVSPREELKSGEILGNTVKIPSVHSDTGRFSTVNLQAELAKSMQQILNATEQGTVNDTISSIKKMVGEMPKRQELEEELKLSKTQRIPDINRKAEESWEAESDWGCDKDWEPEEDWETEEEFPEPSLNIDFQEILTEGIDGQMSIPVPDAPKPNLQITGQMSIEDILAEWEKTKEAARIAIEEAEERKLDEAKARALKEAESLMERLAELQEELTSEEPASEEPAAEEVPVASEEPAAEEPTAEEVPVTSEEPIADEVPVASEEPAAADEVLITEEPEVVLARAVAEMMQSDGTEPEEAAPEANQKNPKEKMTESAESTLEEKIIGQSGVTVEERIVEGPEITLEETIAEEQPMTRLNEEQRQIFTYFTLINGMEQQLCQALEGARERKQNNPSSGAGNLVITGGKGSGKTVLATDFIKAYQKLTDRSGGKIGKISGAVLNQKDVGELFEAVKGGYLIIERAGDLSRESVEQMAALMNQDTGGILVVLEDDKAGIAKALSRNENFAKKFTERIHVPIFTNDELVAFARAYAGEQNCEIEDVGILALYNSISNIQRVDEATTLTEVKEIMDDAIYSANRGGLKKLFGRNRSTENGRVLIKEKDFD